MILRYVEMYDFLLLLTISANPLKYIHQVRMPVLGARSFCGPCTHVQHSHRESVSRRQWGFSLGFRSTLPWSVGWFCTVDLNLYGYLLGTVIAQRFGIANKNLNLQDKT